MLRSRVRACGVSLSAFCLLMLAGCSAAFQGSSSTGSPAPTTTPAADVSVVVTGAGQTRVGAPVQFTATVSDSSDTAVTWEVNGVAGGSATLGTISTKGLYTPPASVPNPNPVTITAVSQASTSASGSMSEEVLNPAPQVSSATVAGTTGPAYTLTVNGTGFVDGSTVMVQGAAATTTFVSATKLTATATPTLAGGATTVSVAVANPNPGAATSPAVNATLPEPVSVISVTVTGNDQVRLGSTSQMTATVANSSNTAVTWKVNGVTGGSSTAGTISTGGLYTPPSSIPSTNPVTITAVSAASTKVSGSLSETVLNPLPVATSASVTGVAPNYTITVNGTGFVSGAQVQVQGTAETTTFVSSTLLTASANLTLASGTTSVPVAVVNPDPGGATSSAVDAPLQSNAITMTAAARLLDQATFGPTLTDMQHVASIGISGYLNEQFQATPTTLPFIPAAPASTCTEQPGTCLQSEWWQAAITAPDQLRQRVAFALAEMYVISTNTVNPQAVIAFQNTLVNDAFGNFSTLMNDVTLSTGMGAYLNMLHSKKPASGQIANENYPREMMQLFSIGIDLLNQDGSLQLDSNGNPIPAYTQDQVQAFARAYTGWTYATASGGSPSYFPNYTANYTAPMAAVESAHDETSKTLLNGTVLPAGQTAEEDLAQALQNIFNHPNVGPFVCRQLIQHLVTSAPSPAYVSRVAAVFADNGSGVRGDMKAVITAILTDEEARAGDTDPNLDGGHLREPVLWLADVIRGLGFTNNAVTAGQDPVANVSYYTLGSYTSNLGQKPYAASSVFNFFPPDYVIPGTSANAPEFGLENTANAILRLSLANAIVYNSISGFKVDLSATGPLGSLASNPGYLVDTLGTMFLHGQMPAQMRTEIVNHISTLKDMGERARVATYLVITSSQYKIEN